MYKNQETTEAVQLWHAQLSHSLLHTSLLQGLRGPGQQCRGGRGQAAGRPLQVTQQDQDRTDTCAQGTHPAGQDLVAEAEA